MNAGLGSGGKAQPPSEMPTRMHREQTFDGDGHCPHSSIKSGMARDIAIKLNSHE
jgi:hypothetical protein